ncbi:hypothetical protein [Streptomyces sp. HUAS TT7]
MGSGRYHEAALLLVERNLSEAQLLTVENVLTALSGPARPAEGACV